LAETGRPAPGAAKGRRQAPRKAPRNTSPPPSLAPKDGLIVTVRETRVRRGQEIKIYIDPGRSPVRLYFNGEWIPFSQDASRRVLTVTIPENAVGGQFEVRWRGKRFRSLYVEVDQGF
jgi:hypothetical protein